MPANIVKIIIGVGSSIDAKMDDKADNNLEKKLQNPNAVALNSVGNRGACATKTMLKANETPNLAQKTSSTNTQES